MQLMLHQLMRRRMPLQGAEHVSSYVTHGVFPNETWRRFKSEADGGGFKYFWITDSCSNTVNALKSQSPFEVLSLAESIAACLQI